MGEEYETLHTEETTTRGNMAEKNGRLVFNCREHCGARLFAFVCRDRAVEYHHLSRSCFERKRDSGNGCDIKHKVFAVRFFGWRDMFVVELKRNMRDYDRKNHHTDRRTFYRESWRHKRQLCGDRQHG